MRQAKVVALAMPRQPEEPSTALPQTIEELKRALSDSPRNDKMRLRLAHHYQLSGMWAEAASELALCLTARPNDADLLCDLAACHIRQDSLEHAAVLMQKAMALQPEHRFALLIESLIGRAGRAGSDGFEIRVEGSAATAVLALDPPRTAELLSEARQLNETGQWAQAADLLRRVLSVSPGNAAARVELGQVHAAEGRWREAYRWYDAARRRAPGDWNARYRMAVAALHMDETAKAAALAREALAVEPSAAPALRLLAGLSIEQGNYEEAEFWLGRLLALDGGDPQIRYSLAWLAFRAGRIAESAEGFRIAAEDEGLRADALYHLGLVQLGLSEYNDAIATLSRAWRTDDSDDAALALAEAHLGAGDYMGAEAALKDLSEPDADAAVVYHKLAVAQLAAGDEEGARRNFVAAVKLDSRPAEGYFALQFLS
jgi:tetratricopeptide (TPR) repeat protein